MNENTGISENITHLVNNDSRKRSASAISLDAGLSRDFIRNIVNGRSKNPSRKNLESLAKTLGTTVDDILGPALASKVKERSENTLERKRESMTMTDLLISLHEEEHGKDSIGILIKNEDIYRSILELRSNPKTVRRAEKIKVEPLKTRFKSMSLNTGIKVIKGKRRLVSSDGTGVWKIRINSGGVLHLGKVNMAKNASFEFLIGTEKDIVDLKTIISTGKSRLVSNLPKKGIWNISTSYINNEEITHFTKWNLDKKNAIKFDTHPEYKNLKDSIIDFFENTERWTRLGGSGTRKFLLYGPPGTGKTQMLSCLSASMSDDLTIVRVKSGGDMIKVAKQASIKSRKTIIICEELDAIKYGTSGDILNFLDGADTPRNVEGTFILFTTNYPKEIDERILKRPGRIDKSIKIGALNENSVVGVARMYLPKDSNLTDKEIKTSLKKTTAAELKEIINDTISIAISENIEFNAKLIMKVRSKMKSAMSDRSFNDDEDDHPDIRESNWERTKDQEDPMDWLTDEEREEIEKE